MERQPSDGMFSNEIIFCGVEGGFDSPREEVGKSGGEREHVVQEEV